MCSCDENMAEYQYQNEKYARLWMGTSLTNIRIDLPI